MQMPGRWYSRILTAAWATKPSYLAVDLSSGEKMAYIYLSLAIVAEVIGTSAIKASEEFTRPGPTILVILGYGFAFYMLSFVLRTIPVGIAYAIWSGIGIALISLVGVILFKQTLDWPAVAGIGLIVSGVAVIHLFSNSVVR